MNGDYIPRGAVTKYETFEPIRPKIPQMSLNDDFGGLDVAVTHHWVADEVYSKRTEFGTGVILGQHAHKYDHASALVRGTVLLEVDGEKREITGPAMLMIEAGKEHKITALTPVVWHCIHITDETDPAKVDAGLIA